MLDNIGFEDLSKLAEEDEKNYTKAKNTHIAYEKDFKDFELFCSKYKMESLPTSYETVRNYLVYLAKGIRKDYKLNTIKRRLSSIAHVHSQKMLDRMNYQ